MQGATHGDLVIKTGRRSTIGESTATPRAGRAEPPTPSGESGRGFGPGPVLEEPKPNRTWLWVLAVLIIILLLVANTGLLINLVATGEGDTSGEETKPESSSSSGSQSTAASDEVQDVQSLLAMIQALSAGDRMDLEQQLGLTSSQPSESTGTGTGTGAGTGTSTNTGTGGGTFTSQPIHAGFPASHLTATFDPYPPSDARGVATVDSDSQVWIATKAGGGFVIQYHLTGLPAEESMGGFSVFTGATCSTLDGMGERGFTHSPVLTALWDKEVGETWARGSVDVAQPGFGLQQIEKHAFVVQEGSSMRIGCGILRFQHEYFSVDHLTAVFNPYPASDAKGVAVLAEGSQVWITANADGSYRVHYYLVGLPPNEEMGGIHVHTGTSCATHDLVLGHFFSAPEDPWTTVWRKSMGSSTAFGSVDVANPGFALAENVEHAFVVHEQSGKRIACGILHSVPVTVERLQEANAQLQAEVEALRQALINPQARRSSTSERGPRGSQRGATQRPRGSGGTVRSVENPVHVITPRWALKRHLAALPPAVRNSLKMTDEGVEFEYLDVKVEMELPPSGPEYFVTTVVASVAGLTATERGERMAAVLELNPGVSASELTVDEGTGSVTYTHTASVVETNSATTAQFERLIHRFVTQAKSLTADFASPSGPDADRRRDLYDARALKRMQAAVLAGSKQKTASRRSESGLEPRAVINAQLAQLGSALGKHLELDGSGKLSAEWHGHVVGMMVPKSGPSFYVFSKVAVVVGGASPAETAQRVLELNPELDTGSLTFNPDSGEVTFTQAQSVRAASEASVDEFEDMLRGHGTVARKLAQDFESVQ